MRFSSRVGVRVPNAIALAEARARRDGVELMRLNDSNPTRHGLAPAVLPGTYEANPRGPLAARRRLAGFLSGRYGMEVDADRLYLLSSTSQAYSWLFKLLCDAGDVVLAPKPGYPLIESIGGLENVTVVEYPLRYDGSWYVDLARVEELLRGGRVRAMVVINPNNPTGSYVKPSERERLVGMCARYGVALIADEVFFDYTLEPFDGNRRLAGERGALTFALDGFSKMLAAPHAKVGWIVVSGPDDVVAEAMARLDVIADDYLPMGDLIAGRMDDLLGEADSQTDLVRGRTRANLRTLHDLLDADPLGVTDVLRAEGGWNVLLRFPASIDETGLALELIRGWRATVQPGFFFDMPSNGYAAVSLLPRPDDFADGVRRFLDAVRLQLS